MENALITRLSGVKGRWIFLLLWLTTLAIYLPAARAGWVIDAIGWIYDMKHHSFLDFINRKQSHSQSFYQLFALHYFIFYKLWGMNVWLWSLLYITVQALNAFLLFIFFRKILSDSGVRDAFALSLAAVLIFTFSPYLSEVIVWKACFHYLLSFFFILSVVLLLQHFQQTQKGQYAVIAAFLFVLASFTLEIFYLLPFFTFSLAAFYRYGLGVEKKVFKKSLLYFVLPQVAILCLYFIAIYAAYGFLRPHKTEFSEGATGYLSKVPKYLFHILFLGRFFSLEAKKSIYAILSSTWAIIVFYAMLAALLLYAIINYKRLSPRRRVMFFFMTWAVVLLAFLLPLSFPGAELLVFYDRYTYFAEGFVYLLLVMLVARFVKNKYLLIALFCACLDVSLYFTIMVNTYWMDSEVVDRKLLHDFPNDESKTVLLLDIPENMNGAPMIGAQPEGMFKSMLETTTDTTVKNKIYDVASYNMTADYNSAHVVVMNDSEMQVVLNNSGSWWWYEGHGAKDYQTPDYRVKMAPPNSYILTLKHPADNYLLLYSVGDKWKKVDLARKNEQQN